MLYQMMTGVRPFEAPTDLEILLRVQRAEFRPPEEAKPDMEPELAQIMMRAMRLDPAERYQSADEMLADVERVLRTVFPPAGQTELKRWLTDLQREDGVLSIGKAPARGAGDAHRNRRARGQGRRAQRRQFRGPGARRRRGEHLAGGARAADGGRPPAAEPAPRRRHRAAAAGARRRRGGAVGASQPIGAGAADPRGRRRPPGTAPTAGERALGGVADRRAACC